MISLVVVISSFVQYLKFIPQSNPKPTEAEQIEDLKKQIAASLQPVMEEQARLRLTIKELTNTKVQPNISAELKRLDSLVAETQQRETKLEEVILDNPSKALELPLIRKDVDSIRERNQADVVAVRQDVDRVYDQNKWFLGLVGTMALGTLTLVVTSFFKK